MRQYNQHSIKHVNGGQGKQKIKEGKNQTRKIVFYKLKGHLPWCGKMSTFADGAFWSKNSTNPLGMDEATTSTLSDFKLYKVGNSTFNKSGTRERT